MKRISAIVLTFVLAACSGGSDAKPQEKSAPMAFPVETMTVARRSVDYLVQAVGTVEAFERVRATARVAGVVEKVHFVEGDLVKEGALLAVIEPERYKVSVDSAKSSMDRTAAAKRDAEQALQRREELAKSNPDLVREEELEAFRARAQAADADLRQAKAAYDMAKINLRDAYVRAPVEGVVQTREVQTGQYVQPGTPVASLVREEPLLVRFAVPEDEAARLDKSSKVLFRAGGREYEAVVQHIAAGADPQSRMVEVVGLIKRAKSDGLRPGTFAEVRVVVRTDQDAVVIPQIAVRPSERGLIAFVVSNGLAEERIVKAGMRTADGRLEILEGLKAGEELVIRGADALRNGAPVRVAAGSAGEGAKLEVQRPATTATAAGAQ
jgi:multidrug efflux system membrane fusion protein